MGGRTRHPERELRLVDACRQALSDLHKLESCRRSACCMRVELEEVGLSAAETAILIALIGRPEASTSDLNDVVADPAPVLRALCARGLAVPVDADDTYRATDPTLLLQPP
jgi:hypothetical protein